MSPAITFDAAAHRYAVVGDPNEYAHVTGILAPIIAPNFADMPADVRDRALERGRIVHDAIAADNDRDLDEARYTRAYPETRPYLDAWRTFRDTRRFVPVLNEYRVASPRHKVAGTIDCLGILDGHAAIVDYKSGNPRDVAADLQTAAYVALALEWAEAGDERLQAFVAAHPVIRRYAVQLRPDGSFRVEAYTRAADFRDFLLLTAAHFVIQNHRRRPAAEAA